MRARVLALAAALLTAWAAMLMPAAARGGGGVTEGDWTLYVDRFVRPDGRVVDVDNDGVTHSEAQGYALLLAAAVGDRDGFMRIWHWTEANLQRDDGLFAWRFEVGEEGKGGTVTDRNNASDADVLIAWSLLRAGRQWDAPELTAAGDRIVAALAEQLLVQVGDRVLLLPGTEGFRPDGDMVVNLSYWIFPAFADFHAATGDPRWQQLSRSGLALLREARFGRWTLPPDWLLIKRQDGALALAEGFQPWFGYNAVRIPLHLVWGREGATDLLRPYHAFWQFFAEGPIRPAWTDLSDDSVDTGGWSTGVAAISALVATTLGEPGNGALARPLDPSQGYFSASLLLLAKLAAEEAA